MSAVSILCILKKFLKVASASPRSVGQDQGAEVPAIVRG
jgi:hypothetical protein